MKSFFYVKQLTDEGRLIDVPEYGPYYDLCDPFPSGYERYEEAEGAIFRYFEACSNPVHSLIIVNIYHPLS